MSEERKLCPNCGHSNRAAAKNCTQCGFAFFNAASDAPAAEGNASSVEVLRKRCSQCGAMNRMGAKVCVMCGKAFRGKLVTFRQKWCPQCGAERRPNAKVCSFCGYRFKPESMPVVTEPPVVEAPVLLSNDLSEPIKTRKDLSPAPIAAEAPKVPQGVRTPDLTSMAVPTEAPIIQSNDLADSIRKRSTTGTTPTPKPPDLSGEPAPYLSPDELSRLRRMGDQTTGLFIRRDKKR